MKGVKKRKKEKEGTAAVNSSDLKLRFYVLIRRARNSRDDFSLARRQQSKLF